MWASHHRPFLQPPLPNTKDTALYVLPRDSQVEFIGSKVRTFPAERYLNSAAVKGVVRSSKINKERKKALRLEGEGLLIYLIWAVVFDHF